MRPSARLTFGERQWDYLLPQPLALVFLQCRKLHLRIPRVRPVDRVALVAERFHGIALRVTSGLGPFRPGVPVGMQRDPFDSKTATPLLELGRPVGGAN